MDPSLKMDGAPKVSKPKSRASRDLSMPMIVELILDLTVFTVANISSKAINQREIKITDIRSSPVSSFENKFDHFLALRSTVCEFTASGHAKLQAMAGWKRRGKVR
jgi:hypothetical protein